MRRTLAAIACLAASLSLSTASHAQTGMDFFKRPSFTKVFNPVVGKGAQYETTQADSKQPARVMDMFIVSKEAVDGKEAYWMEFVSTDDKGKTMVGKMLFSRDDFQFHRMIIQPAGQPAIELPFNPKDATKQKMQDNLNEWHSVGTESITVPAGTFSCEHWKNDTKNSEVWTSDKVSPFGMVKEVSPHSSMVLTKVLTDTQDRITGPVQKFDMQQMMQQMQQQHQQQPKP